jgi:hypothetical protein
MLAELGPDFTGPIHLGHLRAYGCRAYVYDELKARSDKFTSRYDISKLVSYERGTYNIFYIYNVNDPEVGHTRKSDTPAR